MNDEGSGKLIEGLNKALREELMARRKDEEDRVDWLEAQFTRLKNGIRAHLTMQMGDEGEQEHGSLRRPSELH